MAITGKPEGRYYDEYEKRSFVTIALIERWLADCKKRRERYVGKTLTFWGKDYPIVDMVFTEPGLVGWVLYRDGDEIKKVSEGHSLLQVS